MNFGKLLKFLPLVLAGIDAAERIPGLSGADKKAAAIKEAVTNGAALFDDIDGRDRINDAALEALSGAVIDGVFAGKRAAEHARGLKNPPPPAPPVSR